MRALNAKLLRDFRLLRGQVVAIAVVMAAGIAMMTMALSNWQALHDSRERYYAEYRFAEVFASAGRAPRSLLAEIRALEGVRSAQARVRVFVNLEIAGFEQPVTGEAVSLAAAGDPDLNALYLRRGRLAEEAGETVLSERFAEAHGLQPGDEIVALLNGRRQTLQIVGVGLSPEFVYSIRPGEAFPDFERYGVLWMAPQALATAFDLEGAFNDLVLTLQRGAREMDVIDAVDVLLAPYGGRGAHGRDLQMSHRFLDEELGQLQVMTRLFTAVFLVVAAFLLNIVIGRLVATQREQIAVLKAFGYRRREVAAHYAGLVLLTVTAGVLPGLLIGAWLGRGLSRGYQAFFSFPWMDWQLSPELVLLAFAFALGAGLMGSVAALLRAFRLPPAEAMRPEAPPVFRRSLSERLGLTAWLDPAARMLLRTLERRPLRAGLSVLGIGLGCGIFVMSRFQAGAIEEMIQTQFGLAQREDFAVVFAEPVDHRAIDELAALPGVRAVEALRSAPVLLRVGHRQYRLGLQGIDPGADLRRVLDQRFRPIALPAQGLLLTDHLADMLEVRPGDWLELEFLDGARERRLLPLGGTVREYVGVGAYLQRASLNALRGEGDVVDSALLAVDPARRGELLAELRARPKVAAISDRSATLASFRRTMAEGILTFTLMASLMAASIAMGVVYNAARLVLAERSREFASLRVLGYTRAEVRRLLQGELFALSLLALLPGFALGYGMSLLLVEAFASDLYRIPLVLLPQGYAAAGLLVLGATAGAALLVRRRLDRLVLAEALKSPE